MALFSKRHYVWLASVCRDMLNETQDEDALDTTEACIEILAEALENESETFNKERFFEAIYRVDEPQETLTETH